MKKLLLLAALGAVTLLSSCIRPEKLSFEGIESIQVKGATASQVAFSIRASIKGVSTWASKPRTLRAATSH
jgi:hypothetical protein